MTEPRKEMKWARFAAAMSTAAIVKVVLIVVGYLIGTYLDGLFGTKPWLMILCFLTGGGVGFWYFIYTLDRHRPK